MDAARNRLFENVNGNALGLDLAALNIQVCTPIETAFVKRVGETGV